MKAHPTLLCHQQGVAVVTALLLTTLAITIVTSLFWQQQVQVRAIENQRLQLQSEWIMRGALDWASLILREDAKYSSVDTLDEPWSVPLAETKLDQYVDNKRADTEVTDATLSGGISDAQGRYNLTNLSVEGTIDPVEVAVFERLLSNAELNPAIAQATANMIKMSQTNPDASANTNQQTITSSQIDDLLAVPGVTPPMLERIKDLVIFLPRATQLNVNTASAEVLAARISTLSLASAVALVASRKTASFRDMGDFSNRLHGSLPGNVTDQLTVTSNFFLVNGKVRLNRAHLEIQALIERNDTSTKLIWVRNN
jgi:general secretion pathway protein K